MADYSAPAVHAHKKVTIKGYVDRVEIALGAEIVARHRRSYVRGDIVYDPLHYLSLLERKPGALDQAAPLRGMEARSGLRHAAPPPRGPLQSDGALVAGAASGRHGINRLELVRLVAGETGLSPAAADAAVRAALARGEAERLSGFGAFAAKHRPAHAGRNPATGERIAVPASRSVSFRAGKGLRDAVNRATG